MKGRICIITGANSGIGRVTAIRLAEMGALLVLICRSEERGRETVDAIRSETGSEAVDLLLADLSSQSAIRQVAEQFLGAYPALHVLVNNAGMLRNDYSETIDGIETVFAVNHLASFLLTHLLLGRLKESAPSRIVNVASASHRPGTIRFDDLGLKNGYSAWRAYNQSKLANVLFTYELTRRLEGSGVTANCLHPGPVLTRLGHDAGGLTGIAMKYGAKLATPFLLDTEKGAETSIYLASSPEVEGVSGKYFQKCRPVKSSKESYDEDVARRLWKVSADLTGVGA